MSKFGKHPWEKASLGDVFAMQLGCDCWAVMRFYKDTLGVLPFVAVSPEASIVQWFKDTHPQWHPYYLSMRGDPTVVQKIGNLPFALTEDEWAPPCYWPPGAIIPYQVNHRGEIWVAKPEEVTGMNTCFRRDPSTLKLFLLDRFNAGEMTFRNVPDNIRSNSTYAYEEDDEQDEAQMHVRALELESFSATKLSSPLLNADSIASLLSVLSSSLNTIADEHGEITDTDIRERTYDVIHHGFIYRSQDYVLPHGYNTDSAEADAALRAVLRAFVKKANELADAEGLDTPEKRHAAFQADPDLELDEFFGWSKSPPPPSKPTKGTSMLDG